MTEYDIGGKEHWQLRSVQVRSADPDCGDPQEQLPLGQLGRGALLEDYFPGPGQDDSVHVTPLCARAV